MDKGSKVKHLRHTAGLSQKGLADASGVNIRQIQKIEAGEILPKNITLENAVRLAKALGVQPADLIDRGENEGKLGSPPQPTKKQKPCNH